MKHTLLALCAVGACALPMSSLAAANTFIKFDNFIGASIQKGHEDWSEVNHWAFSVAADSSWIKGGGASVGKPQPSPFQWTQDVDGVYTDLFTSMVSGKAVSKVQLQVTKNTAGASPEVYFKMDFSDTFFTRLDLQGAADGNMDLAGQFVFKTLKIEYKPQDPKTGKLGAAKTATWNIATNASGTSFYEFSGDAGALMGLAEAMPSAVPEPSSYLLMLAGLAGVSTLARRRSRAVAV